MTGLPPESAPPTKWPGWKIGGATILTFVALLYIIEILDQLSGHRLDRNGIRPLETDGLKGILFSPFLHADWGHLLANTGPALVLGFLVTLTGIGRFIAATAIIWIVGGLGTWLLGDLDGCPLQTNHIGASGLVFGWLGFLLVFGWLSRHLWWIGISLVVLFVYGGILWGAVPSISGCGGVSWQGHLTGALAGVLAAYVLSRPERDARKKAKAAPSPAGPFG